MGRAFHPVPRRWPPQARVFTALAKARPDLEGAGQILAFVLPEKDLSILGFHKEIRRVDMTVEAFEDALNRIPHSRAEALESRTRPPLCAGRSRRAFPRQAWRLTRDAQSPEATDADFVDAHVLKGVLDIQDARNNPRLKHLPEPSRPEHGWSSRAAFAHPDRVLVLLHPIPFGHIRHVADQTTPCRPRALGWSPKSEAPCSSTNSSWHEHGGPTFGGDSRQVTPSPRTPVKT